MPVQDYLPARMHPPNQPGALDQRLLWAGSHVWLYESSWDRERHEESRDGGAYTPEFLLMRQGSFVREVGSDVATSDPSRVAFSNTRDLARVSHPQCRRNMASSFIVDPDLVSEMLGDLDPHEAADAMNPFLPLTRPISPSTYLRYCALVTALERPDRGGLEAASVEEAALALVWDVVRASREAEPQRTADGRNGRARTARDRIPEVQAYLTEHHARSIPLEELSEVAGCTKWRLCRLFAEETGRTISAYVRQIRLRLAARHILDGADSLTDVALACGFASHSHLSTACRAEFGVAPSRFRTPGVVLSNARFHS